MIGVERRHDPDATERILRALPSWFGSNRRSWITSFEDEGYAATRAFYRSIGFVALEEIRGIGWDGPTVIMVKALG